MPNLTLSDARVKALRPRKTARDIRDAKLRGFGVRVLPSGAKRFFLHTQHRGQRVCRIVGDASAMPVADARTRAASSGAATHSNSAGSGSVIELRSAYGFSLIGLVEFADAPRRRPSGRRTTCCSIQLVNGVT